MLFRQGDIYIESVRCLPDGAVKQFNTVLADGELTGHRHRILDFRTASVFDARGEIFIDVIADRAEACTRSTAR
jgi:hypothetical protein